MAAPVNLFVGVSLLFLIGVLHLGLSPTEVFSCIVASNVAALTALLLYSAGGRITWARRHLLGGAWRTWSLFMLTYFGLLLWLGRPLRKPANFGWLVLPSIMTTAIAITIYGPIQDWLVSRHQGRRPDLGSS